MLAVKNMMMKNNVQRILIRDMDSQIWEVGELKKPLVHTYRYPHISLVRDPKDLTMDEIISNDILDINQAANNITMYLRELRKLEKMKEKLENKWKKAK